MTHGAFLGSKSRASPYSSPAWCNRSLEVSVRRRLWAFSGVWGVESRCGSAGPVAGGLGWALVGQHAVGAGRRRLGIIVVVVARRSACGRGQPLAAGEGVREVARPSPARHLQAELGPAARERIRTRSRALGDGEGSGRLNQGTNEPRRVALSRRPVVLESTSVSWAILDLSAQHAGPGLISNR